MTKTTFSASLARSFPRGASPEAVFFPAAAIQLLARIALLRRAKARWIPYPWGFPGSVFPRRAGDFCASGGDALAVRSQGDEIRSMCKPVPNTDVADDLRLVLWKLLLTLDLPGRALCLLLCRFLCGLLLPELRQLPLIFRLKFRCLPRDSRHPRSERPSGEGHPASGPLAFHPARGRRENAGLCLAAGLSLFHSAAPPSSEASAERAARRASFFAAFFAACSALYFSSCAANSA